jgi:hypothetical protein
METPGTGGIAVDDTRYGGLAGLNGGRAGTGYQSTLGYPAQGKWTHVVATFKNHVGAGSAAPIWSWQRLSVRATLSECTRVCSCAQVVCPVYLNGGDAMRSYGGRTDSRMVNSGDGLDQLSVGEEQAPALTHAPHTARRWASCDTLRSLGATAICAL